MYRTSSNRGPGLFLSRPFSTRPLNEAGFYTGPASVYTHTSRSGFLRVLFHTVHSSKLESDFRLDKMETSAATRTGLEINFYIVVARICV